MEEYNGSSPMNSRISIDYSPSKPKVKFSFPDKNKQVSMSMLKFIMPFFILINFPTYFIVYFEVIPSKIINILLLLQIFLVPILLSIIFNNKFKKIFPDIMAFLAKKKIVIFNTSDVYKHEKGYYCEIPLFENILLDYVATRDFSKQLKFFEIMEYNFKYLEETKEVNEDIWYARFYFKNKPLDGKLEVTFK